MEWIKEIFKKHVKEDGTVDEEAANKEIDAEFPKHAVVKSDFNDKVSELKSANELVDSLKKSNKSNENLQTQVADYEKEIASLKEQQAEDRKTAAVELALTQAGAKNNKAAVALLDLEKVEATDSGFKGLEEQIKTLKKEADYLFQSGEQTKTPQIVVGGNASSSDVQTGNMKQQMKNEKFNLTSFLKAKGEDD